MTVIRADDVASALTCSSGDLSGAVADGGIPQAASRWSTSMFSGRYGFEHDVLPGHFPSNLNVTFRTMHGSKGLEADYIVIPGMTTGVFGFPSNIADDTVLDLAMPAPESFAHAEERRLLYVALTRARRGVTLITSPLRMSPFVIELLDEPHVTVTGDSDTPVEVCSMCGRGTMVERSEQIRTVPRLLRLPGMQETTRLSEAADVPSSAH